MLTDILGNVGLQSILAGLCAGFFVYYLFFRKKYKLPPGPFALPLVGNFGVYTSTRFHRKVTELSGKYGPVFRIKLGPQTWVFLNNIDVVMEALVTRKADFANRPIIHSADVFTDGGKDIAFAQYSPIWRLQRNIAKKGIRQFLSGQNLEEMVNDAIRLVAEEMEKENGQFDPAQYLDQITYIMLFKICFGKRCVLNDPDIEYYKDLWKKTQEAFANGLIEDIVPYVKDIWPTQKYKAVIKIYDEMKEFMWKFYKEHKNSFDPGNIRDFTDALLLARMEAEEEEDSSKVERLSDVYLLQTISDIFSAGRDTTRITLHWFVLFIAGHPEIQKKCHQEIDKAVGKDRKPQIIDRENLQYTEACLYETMRLAPVTPTGLPHSAACDSTIGGYDIPKGTPVMINHFALHMDPKYWKDVEVFRPERYLNADGKIVGKPESWLPFSAGKRACLGEPVAKLELTLICACLLQRFVIKLPPGVTPNFKEADVRNIFIPEKYEVIIEKRIMGRE